MDHLPPVSQSRMALPRVHYACTSISAAIPGDYSTYPTAYGVDMKTFNYRNLNKMSIQDAACFFQEWLFFRLLESVFSVANVPFRRDEFILTNAENETVVTTSRLPAYLWYWLATEIDTSEDLKERKHAQVSAMLRETASVTVEVTCNHARLHPLLGNILASITLAGELLSYAALLVYDRDNTDTPIITWPRSQLLSTLIKDAGWCAHELAVHLYREHNNTLLYLSNFSQRSTFDHSGCTDAHCNMNQLDYDEYTTSHVDTCQGCRHLGVDWTREDSISSDLEARRIPLLSVSTRHPGTHDVQLFHHKSKAFEPPKSWAKQILSRVRSDRRTQGLIPHYVAISHVWSDGMGNTMANTLPTCQLLQLQQLVDSLYPTDEKGIPFWVDTICVPRPPELRAKALQRMRQTYAEADKVLVLDNSIRCISLKQCSPEEAFMRVRCAKWSRRLWTYQEGLLAKKLYFQFKDGAISAEEILRRVPRERFNSKAALLVPQKDYLLQDLNGPHSIQARKLLRALGTPGKMQRADQMLRSRIRYGFDTFLNNSTSYFESCFAEGKSTPTFEEVAYALSQRTTSRLGDETICMANLLNLGDDVQRGLLEIDSDNTSARMIKLLESLDTIPKEIIFSPGPRLEQRGYRWAPQSLMSKGHVSFHYDARARQNAARIHPQGLGIVLTAHGISLDETSSGFRDSESIKLNVQIDQGHIRPYEVFIPSSSWSTMSRFPRLAIILRERLQDWYQGGLLVSLREGVPPDDVTNGMMVAIHKQVVVTPYTGHSPSIPIAHGKLLSGDSLWCVDG